MQKINTVSVSFLNDYKEHAEWLHPFYSTLSYQLNDKNIKYNHLIVQNDINKEKAKNNINKIINYYDLDFYNPIFIDSGFGHITGTGNHHGRAIGVGFKKLKEKILIDDNDLFLIEELDLIHSVNYFENLKKLYTVSNEFDSFFGFLYNGKNVEDHHNLDGGNHYSLPRIFPHFLGIPKQKVRYMIKNAGKFESKRNNRIARKTNIFFRDEVFDGEKTKIWIDSDTGTDLFYDLLQNQKFFHLQSKKDFVSHIGAVTASFNNIIVQGKRQDFNFEKNKQRLKGRFDYVKNFLSYIDFPNDSIFSSDEYNQELKHLIGVESDFF